MTITEIMMQHSSTDRASAFAEWAEAQPHSAGADFWAAVEQEWCGFDAIPHDRFCLLFKRFKKSRPDRMVADCLGTRTVFRGQDGDALVGLAWTRDFEIACQFARGHRGITHETPVVIEMKIEPTDIAMVIGERGESEVVLFSVPLSALICSIEHELY